MRLLKFIFSKTTQQNSYILHTNSPLEFLTKFCSNGGATYIVGEIIAKDNLNSKFNANLYKSYSPKLHVLKCILRYCTQIVLGSV